MRHHLTCRVLALTESRKLTADEVTGTLGIVSESPFAATEATGKLVPLAETGISSKLRKAEMRIRYGS